MCHNLPEEPILELVNEGSGAFLPDDGADAFFNYFSQTDEDVFSPEDKARVKRARELMEMQIQSTCVI